MDVGAAIREAGLCAASAYQSCGGNVDIAHQIVNRNVAMSQAGARSSADASALSACKRQ